MSWMVRLGGACMVGGLALSVLATPASAVQERMTPELLWDLVRVRGGTFSPDGLYAVYSKTKYTLADNSGETDLWVADLGSGETFPIREEKGGESGVQFVETMEGTRLYYVAKTDEVEHPQVFSLDPSSGLVEQVTSFDFGVSNLKVAPTGRHLAFTRDVKMDQTVNELFADLPHADARIIDSLLYRHWDSWHDYAYSHLHVAEIGRRGRAFEPVDVMDGLRFDCPVPPFGGASQFAWSPDGTEIAWTMKVTNRPAESTDTNVFVWTISSDESYRCLTTGMPGYDQDPVYSPDGKFLAFHSMERAGFEADRNRIMLIDRATGSISELTTGLDQTCHGATWAPDSQSVYFMSEWRGTNQLFNLTVSDKTLKQVTKGQFNWSLSDVSADGSTLLVSRQSMVRPHELGWIPSAGGDFTAITDVNGEVFANLKTPTVEERWVTASDGKKIHSWVIYPPDFDESKQYPLITYCQGGPQGQIGQWFSYRWNFHLMAAQGYVVLAPNRRGLPGFGREWNDQISKDWGGQAMQDILSTTDSMLTEKYIDKDRVAAIGASFGGYTVYWLMGNHEGRFATMIAHAGLFNLESFYCATEELFFANWDVGGPYWSSEAMQKEYDRNSPHKYVANWRTPLLVIHGEKDYRVPINQGMEAFTAAQLEGVPSRFLYFPEENHWILSAQNGVLWHRVFFDWLKRTCEPEVAGAPGS